MSEPIDDGSEQPLGSVTPDGELEVCGLPDGTIGYAETSLGVHQRWLRHAPDLYEIYMTLLERYHQLRVARREAR